MVGAFRIFNNVYDKKCIRSTFCIGVLECQNLHSLRDHTMGGGYIVVHDGTGVLYGVADNLRVIGIFILLDFEK